jgi:hypothetical protein
MKRRMLSLAAALGLVLGACPAFAQPAPITAELHPFPGSVLGTTSAASSGLAFADRWLGDEPFANPALSPVRRLSGGPLLQRVSRQDLRADNRQFDDSAVFDFSSAWGAFALRDVCVFAYAWQPVARFEDFAYIRGDEGSVPAGVVGATTEREIRAGGGLSYGRGAWRVGAAVEWTKRDDSWGVTESYGVPVPGTDVATLTGDGIGFALGGRWETKVLGERALTLGAALHQVPELDLTGSRDTRADGVQALAVTRGSAMEYGASAGLMLSPAVRVSAQVGGRGEQSFDQHPSTVVLPFDNVKPGPAAQWSLGMAYAEPDQPLTLRFGGGQESQTGVPEPRAGVYSLGAGWRFGEDLTLDLAGVRRSIARAGKATSYDDRVVASVVLSF